MGYYEKIQRMTLILLEIVSLGAPLLLLMFSVFEFNLLRKQQ